MDKERISEPEYITNENADIPDRNISDKKDQRADWSLSAVLLTPTSAAFELNTGDIWQIPGCQGQETAYTVLLDGERCLTGDRTIFSLYDLSPDREYTVTVLENGGSRRCCVVFSTEQESVVLDVRSMGAKGDGVQDDTPFLQAAVMICPPHGRVLIPKGRYRVTALFLKSGLRLELAAGAVLSYESEAAKLPVIPGKAAGHNGGVCDIGTWEGEARPMYASCLAGYGVENVKLYGQGTVCGNASFDNWWKPENRQSAPHRPRMLFLSHCRGIAVQGLCFTMCPAWSIHPYFSSELRFCQIQVFNPQDSPNTDGLNPESCRDVEITGCHFSVGDDCIAVKSGRMDMAARYHMPCRSITIRQCLMEKGHGAVTVGSEIGAGVYGLTVRDCLFRDTDRGLRIKTRRGRGEECVVEDVLFEHIVMNRVLTPVVVNCYYNCDPDGKSDYVQDKLPLPVDERTPRIGTLVFRRLYCTDSHYAAVFCFGLPEQPVAALKLEDIRVRFALDAQAGLPAMMNDVPKLCRAGLYIRNTDCVSLRDIDIEGWSEASQGTDY